MYWYFHCPLARFTLICAFWIDTWFVSIVFELFSLCQMWIFSCATTINRVLDNYRLYVMWKKFLLDNFESKLTNRITFARIMITRAIVTQHFRGEHTLAKVWAWLPVATLELDCGCFMSSRKFFTSKNWIIYFFWSSIDQCNKCF